jgi:rhodanese-related sulfurtransferase
MGVQRRYNYALQPMSKAEFVAIVTADQPEAPQYFAYDAMLNRQERPTLSQSLSQALQPLSLDFGGAHMHGSVNISLRGSFATWAGTILQRQQPLVLVAEPGCEVEAATRLGRIGYDHIAGYLDGGMQALALRPDLVERTERITAATLAERLAAPQPPWVLDVRTVKEWQDKHIAGSYNIPLHHLEERLAEVPRQRQVVVHCGSGYRSSIAVSLLAQHGFTQVADMVGGFAAWEASQLATAASA